MSKIFAQVWFFLSATSESIKKGILTHCVSPFYEHTNTLNDLCLTWVFLSKVVTYFDGKIFLRPGFDIDRPAQTLDESHLRANLNFKVLFVNVAKKTVIKTGCSGALNVYQYTLTPVAVQFVFTYYIYITHSLASKQECERKHKRIFLLRHTWHMIQAETYCSHS